MTHIFFQNFIPSFENSVDPDQDYFVLVWSVRLSLDYLLQSALLIPISDRCDLCFQRQLHCLGSCPEAPFVFAMGGEKQLKVWDIRDSSTGIVDNLGLDKEIF